MSGFFLAQGRDRRVDVGGSRGGVGAAGNQIFQLNGLFGLLNRMHWQCILRLN